MAQPREVCCFLCISSREAFIDCCTKWTFVHRGLAQRTWSYKNVSAHTSASLIHFRKTYNDICNWKWSYSVLFNLEIVYTEGLICGFSLFSVCAYVLPYIHVFSLYILDGVSQQSGPSWLCLDCHVMCCAGLWCVQAERPTKRHTDRHTDRQVKCTLNISINMSCSLVKSCSWRGLKSVPLNGSKW